MAPDASALGAILLAAGSSSRLGQSKQLVEIDGESLVMRQAKLLASLGVARVVVVTGAEASEFTEMLADLPVRCVHNPDWAKGMGSSLACGIKAMPERVRAALVLLCDQWRIQPADLQQLMAAWTGNPQAAVLSTFEDATGPPAILPRAMFERLSRLQGDTGARRILKRWKGDMLKVPVERAGTDLDLPQHLPD
jgi:molybdenum cofactor cytidylyltransferase